MACFLVASNLFATLAVNLLLMLVVIRAQALKLLQHKAAE